MGKFPVKPDKEMLLYSRMAELNIKEEDIEESFVKGGGPGGQKVNKTATCVYLKHIPTGIEVKCHNNRSQLLNRYYARIILLDKIEQLLKGKDSKRQKNIEKVRKQKLKRAKRAKNKINKRLLTENESS
ncbi:MAG: peptide chain release factor-like protein [Thermodesulfovibrionales bacterium]|nr:peptide chain release factor-like protein [Thermodesulfovibrionales bacterium]